MPADPRDDFGVLEGTEHMLFGLDDPYGVIRREVERYLRATSPDLEVRRITAYGDPKWLTITRRTDVTLGAAPQMTVTGFAMVVRARITSSVGYAVEYADAAITLLCCRWDEPERELVRAFVDRGTDADAGFTDEAVQQRLFAFRAEVAQGENLR